MPSTKRPTTAKSRYSPRIHRTIRHTMSHPRFRGSPSTEYGPDRNALMSQGPLPCQRAKLAQAVPPSAAVRSPDDGPARLKVDSADIGPGRSSEGAFGGPGGLLEVIGTPRSRRILSCKRPPCTRAERNASSFQISANRGDRIVVCRERGAAPRSKFPAIIRAAQDHPADLQRGLVMGSLY
jgi:hypothetical protein